MEYKAIFMGKIVERDSWIASIGDRVFPHCFIKTEENLIKHGKIDSRPIPFNLDIGDEVYISSMGCKSVTIESKAYTTNGEIVYFTDHVIETVNKEEHKNELERLEKVLGDMQLKTYISGRGGYSPSIHSGGSFNVEIYDKPKKWWQFWR